MRFSGIIRLNCQETRCQSCAAFGCSRREGRLCLILTFEPWPIPSLMNPPLLITTIDFKKRGLILLCSATELRFIRRPPLTIKAEFCHIFNVAADIFIKALKIPDAFICAHHLLRDQITDQRLRSFKKRRGWGLYLSIFPFSLFQRWQAMNNCCLSAEGPFYWGVIWGGDVGAWGWRHESWLWEMSCKYFNSRRKIGAQVQGIDIPRLKLVWKEQKAIW